MEQYINKAALVAEIENYKNCIEEDGEHCGLVVGKHKGQRMASEHFLSFIDTLEVKEVDVCKTVDNINPPQADKNKIYCVLSKNKYLLAKVINNPQDEDLLQWKCTEFPFHRYDMCEGDKYMQIV